LRASVRPTAAVSSTTWGNAVDQTPLFSLRKNFITKEPGLELF
jgi:hypothetical protein